jgi:N-methylhydantoinase A
VPPSPGLLCALGLLVEDLRADAVRTNLAPLDAAGLAGIGARFDDMERELGRWLDRERVPPARRRLDRWLDLRYVGQNFELLVPAPPETWRTLDPAPLGRRFREMHERVYGFAAEDEPIQVVNLRLVARGLAEPPKLAPVPRADGTGPVPAAHRRVFVDDSSGSQDCPVYRRSDLRAGHSIDGPAVIEQFDATLFVMAGQAGVVDELGFVVLRPAER